MHITSLSLSRCHLTPAGRAFLENRKVALQGRRSWPQGRQVQGGRASADVAGHRRAGAVQLRHGGERPGRDGDEVL